jgi:prepilin-type N-terminal cleavage/methylation domain-containing protein
MERASSHRGIRAGYTLVELMMVVTIIAVSVLAFMPGFSRAMADRRVSLATREVIRIGRRARAETFGYLRAHLLWITPGTSPGTSVVQLLRGPTNSCTLTSWNAIAADCAATPMGQRCVENLSLSSMAGGQRSISVFEEQLDGSNATIYSSSGRALCFQPSGVMMYGSGADVEAATKSTELRGENVAAGNGTTGGGFIFSLVEGTDAPNSANKAQRVHRVLFPMGGSARSLR